MMIKNFKALGTTKARRDALNIMEYGLEKTDPLDLVYSAVKFNPEFKSLMIRNKTYDIIRGRIFVVGGGKAGGKMAFALEKLLRPENIADGLVTGHIGFKTKKIRIECVGHPFPDRDGVNAAKQIMKMKTRHKIGEKDLVLCLISGGASSMLPLPAKGISLADKRKTTLLLLESGAAIGEINTVRKHISQIKGGRLADRFFPARVVSMIISDVIGNKPEVIGSGLTVPDSTTFMDAYSVLANHGLMDKVPASVRKHILDGCEGKAEENPKVLENTDNFVIGDSATALDAMAYKAKNLGYNPMIIKMDLTGKPEEAAEIFVREAFSKKCARKNAIICGGETYPKLPSVHGKGGRNLHFTLAAMEILRKTGRKYVILSLNSDGSDFKSDAAGALADNAAADNAVTKGLDPQQALRFFDSYNFFKSAGRGIIKTGNTGTNVADLMLLLK